MNWFISAALELVERLPLERLFTKRSSQQATWQELQDILGKAHPITNQPPADNPLEAIPEEHEDLHGYLEPRQQKVHLESNPKIASDVTTKETVDYQNRELSKALLKLERHFAQKLRINGKVCDCGQSRHLLEIEGLSEETIGMVDNPDIYYRLITWVKAVGPKSTIEAVNSGNYDNDYPVFSKQARDFRKELLGTLETSALFPKKETKEEVKEASVI